MKKDIYEEVTEKIITKLEQGIIPWKKAWRGQRVAVSHSTGKPYSLLNQMLLDDAGEYATFKQISDEGGRVKKGVKGRMVVLWKNMDKPTEKNGEPVLNDDGTVKLHTVWFLKKFIVFNVETDCEGITPKYIKPIELKEIDIDAKAEEVAAKYVSKSGVHFRTEKQDRAYYRPSTDTVVLPLREQFVSTAEYYSTLFHEFTHSTGHESRLCRKGVTKVSFFGDSDYSEEELVAEMGSAYVCNTLGINNEETDTNNAAYIQSWLRALKNDKMMITTAAGQASKAADYILE